MTMPLEQLRAALADRYEIEREIGSGGMATVYLARDIRHKREVALKVLRPELGAVLGTERFLAEITVTANLQHPNLLPLFDSGEVDGLLFYVMPFVRGETLRAKIDRERQLSCEEAVRYAVAIASALQHAHEHDVIHRDLKPENILLQSGQPVIADFGIALAVSKAGGARVTQTGLSLGTPQYMSPEQATGEREIDARSDIYSLGAVTYEMLSGEPPHSGSSAQAIIAKLMTSEPQPLSTLRSTIPNNVVCAVEKALAKLPADRFASAQEFSNALQNPSFTIAAKSYASAQQSAAVRKWKRVGAAAGLAAIALLGITLWALLKPDPPRNVVRYRIAVDSTQVPVGGLSRVALSRDGRTFVHTISSAAAGFPVGTGPYLMVSQRSQLEGRVLPGVDLANSPFISDDGLKVGYVGPPSHLKVVSLNGGPPVLISDSIAGVGGCFGPDGSIYATGNNERGIVRLTASPGSIVKHITRVDTAAGELAHGWPEILPGGKSMLFTVVYEGSTQVRSPAIVVADLGSGRYRVLVNGVRARYSRSGHLVYVTTEGTLMAARFDVKSQKITGDPVAVAQGLRVGPGARATDFGVADDGTLFYLAGSAGGDREAVWVARDGKVTSVDSAWKGELNFPALAPDGKRLAVGIAAENGSSVWIKQLDNGPALKLTFEGTNNGFPSWTPDGKNITYFSSVSGKQAIWTKRADGSAQAVLQAREKRDLSSSVWSRDGKWLVIRTSSATPGAGDIMGLRPGIDSVPIPLLATGFTEVAPALSPGGRWLAYVSNETGRQEVYVVPFPDVSSAKWPISTGGGREPAWSHSGRELFMRAGENFVSVPVQTTPTFSAGPPKILFRPAQTLITGANTRQYDVAPGDNRFLFLRTVGAGATTALYFVENWFEELKKK